MNNDRIYGIGPYSVADFSTQMGRSLFVFYNGDNLFESIRGLTRADVLKVNIIKSFQKKTLNEDGSYPKTLSTPLGDGLVRSPRELRHVSHVMMNARYMEAVLYLEERFKARDGRLDVFSRIPQKPASLRSDVLYFSRINFAHMMTLRAEIKFRHDKRVPAEHSSEFVMTIYKKLQEITAEHSKFSALDEHGNSYLFDDAHVEPAMRDIAPVIDQHIREVIIPNLGFDPSVRVTTPVSMTRRLRMA